MYSSTQGYGKSLTQTATFSPIEQTPFSLYQPARSARQPLDHLLSIFLFYWAGSPLSLEPVSWYGHICTTLFYQPEDIWIDLVPSRSVLFLLEKSPQSQYFHIVRISCLTVLQIRGWKWVSQSLNQGVGKAVPSRSSRGVLFPWFSVAVSGVHLHSPPMASFLCPQSRQRPPATPCFLSPTYQPSCNHTGPADAYGKSPSRLLALITSVLRGVYGIGHSNWGRSEHENITLLSTSSLQSFFHKTASYFSMGTSATNACINPQMNHSDFCHCPLYILVPL